MTDAYRIEIRNAAEPGEAELLVYGVIGDGWFDDVDGQKFVKDLAKLKARRIRVRINSVGGDLFSGLGMYNALRAHGAEVVSIVEGLAASAASIVALAGSRIVMRRGTMMMVHQPRARAAGTSAELRAAADVLDRARDSIVDIYAARTGRPADEVRALVDAETWMTAAEAVAGRFADSVDEEQPPALVTAREGMLVAASLGFPLAQVPAGAALAAALVPPVQTAATEPEPEPTPGPTVDDELPVVLVDETPAETPKGAAAAPATAPLDTTPAGLLARAADLLGADGPRLAAALLADGGRLAIEVLAAAAPGVAAALRAEGAAAERARLQAIDDLLVLGHDKLVAEAKYGPAACDASTLALRAMQAESGVRRAYLENRAADAAAVKVPPAPVPVTTGDTASRAVIDRGAARAAARYGRS